MACSVDMPAFFMLSNVLVNTLLLWFINSVMCTWCKAVRLSHNVVAIDVPMAPAVIRTKLLKPAAAGILSGASPANVRVVKGMKKNAMAAP